jgi:hypothetical protein
LQMQHEHVPTERKHRSLCSSLRILDLLRTNPQSKVSGGRGWVEEGVAEQSQWG